MASAASGESRPLSTATRAPPCPASRLFNQEREKTDRGSSSYGVGESWLSTRLTPRRPRLPRQQRAALAVGLLGALVDGGLEFRGEVIRLVRTLRGGDRPKNAEEEFAGVSSLPRGCYEPWGVLRKPLLPRMKVSDCLREFQTGGLRRTPDDKPFNDVILSGRTPQAEKKIAPHPSLKPQAFLRQIVHASLPLGVGVIADTFAGSGATVAAAEALGLSAVGSERHLDYFEMSCEAVPKLAALKAQAEEAEEAPMLRLLSE
jgi:site-specific DNA-methyltransferase (adenine-specific)